MIRVIRGFSKLPKLALLAFSYCLNIELSFSELNSIESTESTEFVENYF